MTLMIFFSVICYRNILTAVGYDRRTDNQHRFIKRQLDSQNAMVVSIREKMGRLIERIASQKDYTEDFHEKCSHRQRFSRRFLRLLRKF
jgi:chromatin segregation and condensation protein Rec8/ScpA/Scc1 (kleisin family)